MTNRSKNVLKKYFLLQLIGWPKNVDLGIRETYAGMLKTSPRIKHFRSSLNEKSPTQMTANKWQKIESKKSQQSDLLSTHFDPYDANKWKESKGSKMDAQ